MHGFGRLCFPGGVEYVGDFHRGEMHGRGELRFDTGAVYESTWEHGKDMGGKYVFRDGLTYDPATCSESGDGWQYLAGTDRRFWSEHATGVQPAGNDKLSNWNEPVQDGWVDAGAHVHMHAATKRLVNTETGKDVGTASDRQAAAVLATGRHGVPAGSDADTLLRAGSMQAPRHNVPLSLLAARAAQADAAPAKPVPS